MLLLSLFISCMLTLNGFSHTKVNFSIPKLPGRLRVPEDTPVHSVIFNLMSLQLNLDQNQTDHSSIFHLDTKTGDLILLQAVDYEEHAEYKLRFTVSNKGKGRTHVLIVEVIDVNEPPKFESSWYTVRTDARFEWQLFPEIKFNVTDPDANDTVTYGFVNGSSSMQEWLLIDAHTGRLRFRYQYDTSGSDVPEIFSIDIEVEDVGGLKDTATLQILIEQNFTNTRASNRTVEYASDPENNDITVYISKSSSIGNAAFQLLSSAIDLCRYDFVQFLVKEFTGRKHFSMLYLQKSLSDTNERFFQLDTALNCSQKEYSSMKIYVVILEDTLKTNITQRGFFNIFRMDTSCQTFLWIVGRLACIAFIVIVVFVCCQRGLKVSTSQSGSNVQYTYLSHLERKQRIPKIGNTVFLAHNRCHRLPQIHTYGGIKTKKDYIQSGVV